MIPQLSIMKAKIQIKPQKLFCQIYQNLIKEKNKKNEK